jgi:hypothetical protein
MTRLFLILLRMKKPKEGEKEGKDVEAVFA